MILVEIQHFLKYSKFTVKSVEFPPKSFSVSYCNSGWLVVVWPHRQPVAFQKVYKKRTFSPGIALEFLHL